MVITPFTTSTVAMSIQSAPESGGSSFDEFDVPRKKGFDAKASFA